MEILMVLISVLLLHNSNARFYHLSRGGASAIKASSNDAYQQLAIALKSRFDHVQNVSYIEKALKSLSSAQGALKGLDGAAYEAYQRTHSDVGSSKDLTSVSGRARRSATRMAATANAFLAAELCEMIESDRGLESFQNENSTLAQRLILLSNVDVKLTKELNVTMVVLWEPSYDGSAGLDHGGIQDLLVRSGKIRGRVLVVLKDPLNMDLKGTIDILDVEHLELELTSGLIANEIASVHPYLYRTAGRVLRSLESTIMQDRFINQTDIAFHFVGRSLAGGTASLAAVILDGSLPMPEEKKHRKKLDKLNNVTKPSLGGFGHGRSSATVLGAPPCLSANVKAPFVKSLIFGDDVVCRITPDGIERLCHRVDRVLKGGILGRRVGWMSDVVSLTVNSIKRHAHGSEGEEGRLVVPGQAFLVRPRKLGGACSMHEVGGLKGGREALRAAVLWQLNDILLSKSFWKHHQLEEYIQGLDKVVLRGAEVGDSH